MLSTHHLLAKTFCYQRQLRWDLQDGITPRISSDTIARLHEELQNRPRAEILQAAQELNIQVNTNEC